MLDCKNTLTHVRFELDETARTSKMVLSQVHNASWHARSQWSESDKKLTANDAYTVRISLGARQSPPAIRKGDILIKGVVDSVEGMTAGQILNQYEAFTVMSVSYNPTIRSYGRHLRVSGV